MVSFKDNIYTVNEVIYAIEVNDYVTIKNIFQDSNHDTTINIGEFKKFELFPPDNFFIEGLTMDEKDDPKRTELWNKFENNKMNFSIWPYITAESTNVNVMSNIENDKFEWDQYFYIVDPYIQQSENYEYTGEQINYMFANEIFPFLEKNMLVGNLLSKIQNPINNLITSIQTKFQEKEQARKLQEQKEKEARKLQEQKEQARILQKEKEEQEQKEKEEQARKEKDKVTELLDNTESSSLDLLQEIQSDEDERKKKEEEEEAKKLVIAEEARNEALRYVNSLLSESGSNSDVLLQEIASKEQVRKEQVRKEQARKESEKAKKTAIDHVKNMLSESGTNSHELLLQIADKEKEKEKQLAIAEEIARKEAEEKARQTVIDNVKGLLTASESTSVELLQQIVGKEQARKEAEEQARIEKAKQNAISHVEKLLTASQNNSDLLLQQIVEKEKARKEAEEAKQKSISDVKDLLSASQTNSGDLLQQIYEKEQARIAQEKARKEAEEKARKEAEEQAKQTAISHVEKLLTASQNNSDLLLQQIVKKEADRIEAVRQKAISHVENLLSASQTNSGELLQQIYEKEQKRIAQEKARKEAIQHVKTLLSKTESSLNGLLGGIHKQFEDEEKNFMSEVENYKVKSSNNHEDMLAKLKEWEKMVSTDQKSKLNNLKIKIKLNKNQGNVDDINAMNTTKSKFEAYQTLLTGKVGAEQNAASVKLGERLAARTKQRAEEKARIEAEKARKEAEKQRKQKIIENFENEKESKFKGPSKNFNKYLYQTLYEVLTDKRKKTDPATHGENFYESIKKNQELKYTILETFLNKKETLTNKNYLAAVTGQTKMEEKNYTSNLTELIRKMNEAIQQAGPIGQTEDDRKEWGDRFWNYLTDPKTTDKAKSPVTKGPRKK